jgi:hypothetical protein
VTEVISSTNYLALLHAVDADPSILEGDVYWRVNSLLQALYVYPLVCFGNCPRGKCFQIKGFRSAAVLSLGSVSERHHGLIVIQFLLLFLDVVRGKDVLGRRPIAVVWNQTVDEILKLWALSYWLDCLGLGHGTLNLDA